MTVVVTEEGGEGQAPSPTEQAVQAVEVLESAHASGVADGVEQGLLLARVGTIENDVRDLIASQTAMLESFETAAQTITAMGLALDDLRTRVFETEVTVQEEILPDTETNDEEVVEETETVEDTTGEIEPPPVTDNTPSRKRHWA